MVLQQLGVKKKTVEKNRTGMLFSLDFGPLIWDLNPAASEFNLLNYLFG